MGSPRRDPAPLMASVCVESDPTRPHPARSGRAERCNLHTAERRRWQNANAQRHRRGQEPLPWTPTPVRPDKTNTIITARERVRLTKELDRVSSTIAVVNSAIVRRGEPTGPQLQDLIIAASDLAEALERALYSAPRRSR